MDIKKTTKKKPKIVTKPFLKGAPVDGSTVKEAVKFFGLLLILMIANLLLCTMLLWDSFFLRVLTNGAVMAAAWMLFYASGMGKGAMAVNNGEMAYQQKERGHVVDEKDLKACYHPLKGWINALLGTIPCFLCAVILALVAKQQLYGISALPSWLGSYTRRTEIGSALNYYMQVEPIGAEGILRLVVRMLMMPLVSILSTENSAAMLLLERLSPLVVLMPALFYGFGYTRGVKARTIVHSSIAAANRKYKRKEKKKQQQRRVRGPEQLN